MFLVTYYSLSVPYVVLLIILIFLKKKVRISLNIFISYSGIAEKLEKFYRDFKPRYVFYTGFTARVFHSKPEHIQHILNSTVHINKSENFQVLKHWLAEGIITSNGMYISR